MPGSLQNVVHLCAYMGEAITMETATYSIHAIQGHQLVDIKH